MLCPLVVARLSNSQAAGLCGAVRRKSAGCGQYLVSVVVPATIWGGGAGVTLVRRRLNLMVTVFHCNGRYRALYDLQPEGARAHTVSCCFFLRWGGGTIGEKKRQRLT